MRKRNPRNPEMIHFRRPLDFWAPNFGMSSRHQLTRNEKHWRTQITTTGCMGADVEAALQKDRKVCSNVSTQGFFISIPKTSSFRWVSLVACDQPDRTFPHSGGLEIRQIHGNPAPKC